MKVDGQGNLLRAQPAAHFNRNFLKSSIVQIAIFLPHLIANCIGFYQAKFMVNAKYNVF
jgi:Na+-transporting NADH:ubiquinone oxidoreductase subunit NqrE